MRLAYADPPYPGQAKRHYGDHPDYSGEVDHAELVERLRGFDGWALSTSNRSLADVLALTGPQRVLSWTKPIAPPFPKQGVFGWEPVIVSWARPPASDLRDTLNASPEQYTFRAKPEGYVTGSKPPVFCRWLFRWLGAQPGDEFTDLFPGSRAVTDAWVAFNAAPTLESAALSNNPVPTYAKCKCGHGWEHHFPKDGCLGCECLKYEIKLEPLIDKETPNARE